jgi:hypothetical protein
VLELERQIEDAVVRGGVAFVSWVLSNAFVLVHCDAWTKRGKPLPEADRDAFLKRAADKEYLVHDLGSVRVEMHGDIAIAYGRYVSLFLPSNRNTTNPGRLNSIWFERVYARRNGRWQFLSPHRAWTDGIACWCRSSCAASIDLNYLVIEIAV